MELIRGLHNLRSRHKNCVATIGNFDGVHRGHRRMLETLARDARRLAEESGADQDEQTDQADQRRLPVTAISFEPDPREYFAPGRAPVRLTSLRDKVRKLACCGVDRFLCLPFNARLAAMPPEEFIHRVLVDGLGVRHLVVGDDFRFGHKRAGDFDTLVEAGRRFGFTVSCTETVREDGERISSTRVRQALAGNDLDETERLLGGPYSISGRVINGERIGRKLGFPTANIGFRRSPALSGIYAVDVHIEGGPARPAVASVGTRPTVNGVKPLLEVYVLNFSGDLYGKHLEVVFRHYLRSQVRYDGLEALKQQIARDVENARAWFAQHRQQ